MDDFFGNGKFNIKILSTWKKVGGYFTKSEEVQKCDREIEITFAKKRSIVVITNRSHISIKVRQ